MIDFRRIIAEIRAQYIALSPYKEGVNPAASATAHDALFAVDRELAIQSFLYLFDDLLQHEQGRDAVLLAAYCIPHFARQDLRVRACFERARKLAEDMRDPLAEQAYNYLHLIHVVNDEGLSQISLLPPRALYWLQTARISRAKTVIEYGTGCGSNVIQCAMLAQDKEWIGIDISEQQVKACSEQAGRLKIGNAKFFTPAGALGVQADVVGVLDVLEHSAFPMEILDAAESFCAPAGIVVITTPNGAFSPALDGVTGTVAGSHVAVESLPTLVAKVEMRHGTLLDAHILPPVHPVERNGNAAVVYVPRSMAGPTRGSG